MLVAIIGKYKKGKTVSACTFPKPMRLFDWDDGFTSVMHTTNKDGTLVVPDWKEIEVIKFIKPEIFDLTIVDSLDFKKGKAPEHTKNANALIKQYNDEIRKLKDSGVKTLVIDSATTMFRIWKEAILLSCNIPGLRINDYGTLDGMLFGQFIPSLKTVATYVDWVILIDHIMVDKEEITGKIEEIPVGPSTNQGRALGKELDEIWKMESDTEGYKWETRPHGWFTAGSRLHLPDPIKPATYQRLKQILDERR